MNAVKTLITVITIFFSNAALASSWLEISNANVRQPIPGMANTAGYMTIHNPTDKVVTLIAASSELANKVEFHDHVMSEGVMKMVKLDKVVIPAGQSKTFESGGLHLMFLGLNKQASKKEMVSVVLKSADGKAISQKFAVKSVKEQHGHHHHH